VGADALYVDKQWINQCLEADIQPVLRTKEERLDIVKDAEGLFSAPAGKGDQIERIERMDPDRGMKYKLCGANGFRYPGLRQPMKVIKVVITMLKGKRKGKTET
jgi:hypothetical protein